MPEAADSPDALYAHRGTRAVQQMVEYAPATGSLALWVHHLDVASERGAPRASNDGSTIRYSPSFERLSLARQTGMVAHQVLHVALRHAPRYIELRRQLGDVDLELFNICADAIVNSALAHLSWLELETGAVLLEDLLGKVLGIRENGEKALLEWDLERLYRAIDDRARRNPMARLSRKQGKKKGDKGDKGEEGGQGSATRTQSESQSGSSTPRSDGPYAFLVRTLGRNSPRDLVPNEEGSDPQAEAAQSREWRERVLRGHAGDGNHSMLRALLADLPKVHTPWEQILRTQLARGLSLKRAINWSRPARSYIANHGRMGNGKRMPWEPGWSAGKAVARLAVMVDVSGSIDEELLARFASEIAAISRRMEAKVVVIVGDFRVRKVEVFEPGRTDFSEVEFHGGGGTNFSPLLQEADRWRPDIGVFLTDLEGPATHRPGFQVIWAVPKAKAHNPHPFGRKLVLE